MRIVAIVGFACSFVSAQTNGEGDMIVDQTSAAASLETGDQTPDNAQLEIGMGYEATAMIDCAKTYDCELVSYDPVCGSDGVTYSNNCAFASAFCAQENFGNTLFIQTAGECPDPADNDESQESNPVTPLSDAENDEPLHTSLQTDSGTETSTEVDLMTVFCSLTCKLTPDQVCGTDGVTYINDCHLLSSKCEHPELEKESHGECAKNKHDIVLNALEVDADGLTEAPEKCNPMCDRIYDPICGSDGITYANACLLEYAECRNPNVKPFGAGKCPPHMQAARTAGTPTSLNNNGDICIPGPCPYTYAPVCGSDGQTHDNLCLFANARCEHPQHSLTVVHDGECDADTQLTCETMTCPTFTECREQRESDETVVAYCTDICSPDRCSDREDCELVDSDCFTAPCSPIAVCIPKVQDG